MACESCGGDYRGGTCAACGCKIDNHNTSWEKLEITTEGKMSKTTHNQEIEIKAELYDLQYHTCNGALSFRKGLSGLMEPDPDKSKNCWGCSRILELQNQLVEIHLQKQKN